MGIRCVVFDVDDTLFLERDYVRSGFVAVGREVERSLGITGFASLAWKEFCLGKRESIFNNVLQSLDMEFSEELIDRLVKTYRTHEPAIVLEPDALSVLEELSEFLPLCLITDGLFASQRGKVASLGLKRYVQRTVYTDLLGAGFGKPHPRSFELIQEELGFVGQSFVYVADNPTKDFDAPRALGWKTYRCRRPLGLHSEAPTREAVDVEAADLSELVSLIGATDGTGRW